MTIKLLYFVNVDWFFISHRLQIALKALEEGYEVHIATTLTEHTKDLEGYGFRVHSVDISRGSGNIFSSFKVLFKIYKIFKKVKPDILHLVTIKPVLLGGVAARFAKVQRVVFSVSGMGYLYINNGLVNYFYRRVAAILYRIALGHKHLKIIFQNPSDLKLVSKVSKLNKENALLIKGSGVDLSDFSFSPLPEGVPIVMLASRMLVDKGVREFVDAAKYLNSDDISARFVLVGEPDRENNASLTIDEINEWVESKDIEYWGHSKNMSHTLKQASIIVLPSYREGMPKVLLEASAVGRPIITTDVPGCRDAIIPDITGLLVPLKNSVELSRALKYLLENRHLWKEMGSKGRKLAEESYGIEGVVNKHMEIYLNLINGVK